MNNNTKQEIKQQQSPSSSLSQSQSSTSSCEYTKEQMDEIIDELGIHCISYSRGNLLKDKLKKYPNLDLSYRDSLLLKNTVIRNNLYGMKDLLDYFDKDFKKERFNCDDEETFRIFKDKKLYSMLKGVLDLHFIKKEMVELLLQKLNKTKYSSSDETDSYEERQSDFDDLDISFPPQDNKNIETDQ